MNGYLRLVLLLIAVTILIVILWDAWSNRRSKNRIEISVEDQEPQLLPKFELNSDNKSEEADLFISVTEPTQEEIPQDHCCPAVEDNAPDILVLSVIAKPGNRFVSYDLLQAISATGLQYGEMNIFHYYQTTSSMGKLTLFSVASANKPGEFDLNNMGDFSCTGLMLFMQLSLVPNPQYAFNCMLETAQQLADDLDGILHATPHQPWNEKMAEQYQKMINRLPTIEAV